ncbi:MAG: glycosyl hydrolase family 28-related protein [Verrucomicrobiota bacterium]
MSLQSSSVWQTPLAFAPPLLVTSPCWSTPPVGESIWLFHTNNWSYAKVDPQDFFQLKAKDTTTPGFNKLLIVENTGSGNVVFKSALNDLYVRVDNGNTDKLVADSSNPSDPLTQFTWTDLTCGKVRLTSVGDPDSTENTSPAGAEEILRANRSGTNSDTEFLWEVPGPRIADTIYSDFDIPLITIDAVAEFGADSNGATDASIAIQAAIDTAFNDFGGIIYFPAGSYLLQNPIIVRKSCTLSSENTSTENLTFSSFYEVFIEFNFEVVSFEDSESFALEISADGGSSYTVVETWINDVDFVDDGSLYNNESALISGFSLTDQTRIRFRCNASANDDDVYLDNIQIFVR